MKQPVCIVLTPQTREKMENVSNEIIELLKVHFTPMEGYALLHVLMRSMRETYGIGGVQEVFESDQVQ